MTTRELEECAERIKRREKSGMEKALTPLEKDALHLANYYIKMIRIVGVHVN